jgi:hypothetical protein
MFFALFFWENLTTRRTDMAKQPTTPRKKPSKGSQQDEPPPGATRKAFDRPLERGGGPPGSAGGPRHAADDVGTESETYGRTDMTKTPASPPLEEEDPLEKGPPYAGPSGGAVGGTPAQLRSSEHSPPQEIESNQTESGSALASVTPPEKGAMRLTGFAAIEYAEKQGLSLNKHPDSINGPRVGLNIGEAEAIADEDPDLIWLDISEEDYYSGQPSDYEPER